MWQHGRRRGSERSYVDDSIETPELDCSEDTQGSFRALLSRFSVWCSRRRAASVLPIAQVGLSASDNPQCVIKGCVKFPCVSAAAPCWGHIFSCAVNQGKVTGS